MHSASSESISRAYPTYIRSRSTKNMHIDGSMFFDRSQDLPPTSPSNQDIIERNKLMVIRKSHQLTRKKLFDASQHKKKKSKSTMLRKSRQILLDKERRNSRKRKHQNNIDSRSSKEIHHHHHHHRKHSKQARCRRNRSRTISPKKASSELSIADMTKQSPDVSPEQSIDEHHEVQKVKIAHFDWNPNSI